MQRYPKFLVESSGKLVGWNQSQESEELFGTELDTHKKARSRAGISLKARVEDIISRLVRNRRGKFATASGRK